MFHVMSWGRTTILIAKELEMNRIVSCIAVAALGLAMAFSSQEAQAQCYPHGARGFGYSGGGHHFHQRVYSVPTYRSGVSLHFGSTPFYSHPHHRHYYGRPNYGWGHPYGGRGITIRF